MSAAANGSPLHDETFMTALLDLMIPESADGTMPAAGRLGLADAVATSIEADRLLREPINAGIQAVNDAALARHLSGLASLTKAEQLDVVQSIAANQPMFMNAFARHLYPAYYQHPRVLRALGEPVRPPFPEGFTIEPTDEGLLRKLESRRIPRPPN